MNKYTHTFLTTAAAVSFSVFAVTGIAYAANIDAKSQLGGGDGDFFNFKNTTLEVGSLKVGEQGSGGVTFFNGTMVNNTTTNGVDNPITISDNLRVDGGIQRGHNLPSDGWGLKFLDSARVYGDLDVDDTITASDDVNVGKNLIVQGDTTLNGDVTWAARVGKTSIPFRAFRPDGPDPELADYSYTDFGVKLDTDPGSGMYFVAPIQLPHGVRITKITHEVYDDSASNNILMFLHRVDNYSINFAAENVSQYFGPSTEDANIQTEEATINTGREVVDNGDFTYELYALIPTNDSQIAIGDTFIEYEFTQPY